MLPCEIWQAKISTQWSMTLDLKPNLSQPICNSCSHTLHEVITYKWWEIILKWSQHMNEGLLEQSKAWHGLQLITINQTKEVKIRVCCNSQTWACSTQWSSGSCSTQWASGCCSNKKYAANSYSRPQFNGQQPSMTIQQQCNGLPFSSDNLKPVGSML